MRLVPLLILFVALPLAAQSPDPTPADFYPLAVGDVREYRGTGPASTPYPRYTARESVVGDTLAGGVLYRLVERIYLEDGQPLVRSRRAVRFDTAGARPVERRPDGTEAPLSMCRLDLADPCALDRGEEPVQIGGDTITRRVRVASNLIAFETYAAGVGWVVRETMDGADYTEQLTFARLDGVRYGSPNPLLPPLAPEPSAYWPLDVGNTWVFRYRSSPGYEWKTILGTQVVSDTSYAVVQTCIHQNSAPTECSNDLLRVDSRTGTIHTRTDVGERLLMCGLLPTAESGGVACRIYGFNVWGLSIEAPSSVQIGGLSVPTPSRRSISFFDIIREYAAGIGPLPSINDGPQAELVYVRIGDIEYGVNPIAGEGTPLSPAFALRLAPNPADGLVTLAVVGATSPADVEAFDALGRRVWRATVAGETTVDVRGWAPGVYLVRATADGATSTTRFVRR